ncbi:MULTISPECIES: DUF4097 domain-containing protein [Prauserella salsuginis group]|uniref:DUF4097 domain-containing protein n=1 Tax=Prauserella salsuginis TaxID=387889 RepID=A0ABW6G283_9PSEU|nr:MULTISPECIES: DUF4097 domain-containing protein [Prauserella salsuginis group]MCR3719919.1 putative adhesin [Prauserella flava]MCR3736537.1 putative adhesin [Prauserella salsuginis]
MREQEHAQQGAARFAVDAAAGEVQVRAGQTDTARVTLEPLTPGDAAAERLIERARIDSEGDRLSVRLPDDDGGSVQTVGPTGPTSIGGGSYVAVGSSNVVNTVIQGNGSVVNTGGGTVVNGAVISGGSTVISNGQVISGGSSGVRVVAHLPEDSAVKLSGGSASLHTTGELASVEAATVSGGVEVDRARSAEVRTTSGRVSVAHTGDLRAHSVSGDVAVRSLAGTAHVRSTSGDVAVHATDDSTLNARSTSGDVTVSALEGVHVDESVKTVSGQVRRRTVPRPAPAPDPTPAPAPTRGADASSRPSASSGGSAMTGIDEVRAVLAAAAEGNSQHEHLLNRAALSYELAAAHVEGAAAGSSAPAVAEAITGYRALAEQIRELVARSEAIAAALHDYTNTL